MAEEKEKQTFLQKLLFYTTAFFILLSTFSLFAFLFLVPFVIDPAFTTIFMQFDTRPAECVTIDVESRRGTSNCSWTSCREGCTKELYDCTQIRVNYKLPTNTSEDSDDQEQNSFWFVPGKLSNNRTLHAKHTNNVHFLPVCWKVYMNLVYAMAIPIPSFIISVIYLTIAYFKIYNEEEEVLVGGEEGEDGGEGEGSNATPLPLTSGALTPGSEAFREDLASFGHQLKVAMADDISRESLDGIPNSYSIQGPTSIRLFQKLEQDDDDEYLNSSWADGSSLKRHFQGLNNISWKPH
ncbi:Protein tipE [Habropoda laboriosa]|uniref:Protein tipE n=1 Tax=Habropoda laboriosa TaxID=597456 RepID=A0A0L7QRI8_9HYME|nr:Protein tipE [Habropoda laboriosa]